MIWYFGKRQEEQKARDAEREAAQAALAVSVERAQQVVPRGEQISDLVSRLRDIQKANHYADRLRAAFGEK